MCRGTLKHIGPSGKYSAAEREEFFNVTQVLAARPLPNKQEPGGKKRVYKVWAPFEKYSLLVGLSIFSTDMQFLNQVLEDRNPEQVRYKIKLNCLLMHATEILTKHVHPLNLRSATT